MIQKIIQEKLDFFRKSSTLKAKKIFENSIILRSDFSIDAIGISDFNKNMIENRDFDKKKKSNHKLILTLISNNNSKSRKQIIF